MELEEILGQIARKSHVMLLEYHVFDEKGTPQMRLVVDTEDGITVAMLTAVTKRLKKSRELNEHFPAGFRLEVSSPGVESPLKESYQFRRNINRTVRMTHEKSDIASPIEGVLTYVDRDLVRIKTNKGTLEVPFESIVEAKVVLP